MRHIRNMGLIAVLVALCLAIPSAQTTPWVVRLSDGAWVVRGYDNPNKANSDPSNFIYVMVPGLDAPDPRLERYDAAASSKRRAATAMEIAAYDTAVQDAAVLILLDQERIFSALVWAIVDTYSPPATITKYNAARTKIITAYKTRPWVP